MPSDAAKKPGPTGSTQPGSDLEFVDRVMRETVEEALGEAMIERVRTNREILAQTPVDQVEVNERPSVLFRINPTPGSRRPCAT